MRLSIGRVSAGSHTPSHATDWDDTGPGVHGKAARRMSLTLAVVLVLGCVGLLFSPAKSAGADTVFASGQVFASVGNSTVNVYDPSTGALIPPPLVDNTNEAYTAGSAFDANGNLYVTDDTTGNISEYSSTGQPLPTFASGLANPLSLVFDNSGNLYVGQQAVPYIAEFNSSGQRLADIGPVATEETGDDWIDLASDECTFYYTTEGADILRYNKCTNTQLPDFNQAPLPGANAYELRILPNGDVLVADSDRDLLLDSNGNVIQTYSCGSLPGCAQGLFALVVDPSGTSFWTGDAYSGDIWQVNIATGAVMQTIATGSPYLFGLSVDDQQEVATPAPVTTALPSTLTVQPVSGNFSAPTPVSAVLTNSSGNPIVNEPVTFTLNGAETCTADTDNTGTATCVITPGEPSSSYTLTASFGGDTSATTPIGSDTTNSTFTVSPDTSSVTTGPATAVNGQSVTLSANLTTNVPSSDTALPTKVVTLTIGTGSTAQSCSGTTDANGNVSCPIATVDQPSGTEPITASFAGDTYDTPIGATSTLSVTEPTTLTVNPTTVSYGSSTTVSGTLTDSFTNQPIPGEPVTFTVNGTETCTGTTDSNGNASCTITPGESAGTYTVYGSFGGDSSTSQPVPLTTSTSSASFVVTPATTSLTYTGPYSTTNGQPITISGVLTSGSTPLVNQPVTLTLGSGSSAQTCSGTTNASGAASCTIASVNQPVGPTPVNAGYGGTNNYQSSSATSSVQVGPSSVSTTLTVTAGTGTYGSPTTVTGTLINNYTNTPVAGEPVTLKVNGTQSCTGTTNSSGVASCTITPNEPGGTYTLSGSFGGDTTTVPTLLPSTGSSTFVESKAPTTVTYTGSTSITSGKSPVLSATLTSNGSPVSGQTVTFTVGSGNTAQKCSGTTNSAGMVSCTICTFNQSASPLPVTVSFGGSSYYATSTASQSVTVTIPTTLSVSAATGAYGQATTISGTLTNSVTGTPIGGQTVTLTLNGTQSCTATTASNGKASCAVTPNEPSATYKVTGTFGGNAGTSPQLLSSSGSNNFVVTAAPTSLTYTGSTNVQSGQSLTLTSVLTSNGTPLAGQPVVMTIGSGRTVQSCTGTTNSSGVASCTITVNQVTGSVAITVSYAGNSYYQSSSASTSEQIGCGGGGGGGSGGGGSGSGGCGGSGGGCRPPVGGEGEGCG